MAAIEEALRWEPPTQFNFRIVTRDTELGGVRIPRGSGVTIAIGAVNHDPAAFPDPEHYDLSRRRPHTAFGFGIHTCLGMHLARVEMQSMITELLLGLPGLRPAPDAPTPQVKGTWFRYPASVNAQAGGRCALAGPGRLPGGHYGCGRT
jgi:cytochrome P450